MPDNVVFAVGNSMMGDDGAGPLLAEMMRRDPIAGWDVIDGGMTPENHVHRVVALQPRRVYLVDAAEMELAPGEIRIVEESSIADMLFMTTHSLPLSFVIEHLQAEGCAVTFIGIQPGIVAFYCPMLAPVKDAVTQLYARMASGGDMDEFERI
ncbi:hydrogenase maturation peptidase HycI [Paludibacterium yongneupense]|uniref:hydrogenase maturation peptidase HycI n=1 Tax=Paludibacterium yongneupense TaxID=400061 RepID=UPI00041A05C3|nr:hydrogenase maturation peptidase HycI [Paludibacterium yongneupense]